MNIIISGGTGSGKTTLLNTLSRFISNDDRIITIEDAAELRLQHIMGLQTFNSIRALDWITSLPDVDAQRVAVTGASGGGTQTILPSSAWVRCRVA